MPWAAVPQPTRPTTTLRLRPHTYGALRVSPRTTCANCRFSYEHSLYECPMCAMPSALHEEQFGRKKKDMRCNSYSPRKKKSKKEERRKHGGGASQKVVLFDLTVSKKTWTASRFANPRGLSTAWGVPGTARGERGADLQMGGRTNAKPTTTDDRPELAFNPTSALFSGRKAEVSPRKPQPPNSRGWMVQPLRPESAAKRETFLTETRIVTKKPRTPRRKKRDHGLRDKEEQTRGATNPNAVVKKEWWDICSYQEGWQILRHEKNRRDGLTVVYMNNRRTGKVQKVVEGMRMSKAAATRAFDACADIDEKYLNRWRAMAAAAHVAVGAGGVLPWLAQFETDVLDGLEAMILDAKFQLVQAEINRRLCKGTPQDKCPLVSLDVFNKALVLEEPLNFEGGKDIVVADDLPLLKMIQLICWTLYDVLTAFGWEMFHLQVDGHVHPTGKDTKCLVVSYFRALTVANFIAKSGIPSQYLHIFGYGGTRPLADESLNRRVEITLLENNAAAVKSTEDTFDFIKSIRDSEEYRTFRAARKEMRKQSQQQL